MIKSQSVKDSGLIQSVDVDLRFRYFQEFDSCSSDIPSCCDVIKACILFLSTSQASRCQSPWLVPVNCDPGHAESSFFPELIDAGSSVAVSWVKALSFWNTSPCPTRKSDFQQSQVRVHPTTPLTTQAFCMAVAGTIIKVFIQSGFIGLQRY